MEEVLCSKSAFRYWRCPPQVRELYPALPDNCEGPWKLKASPFVRDVLKAPLNVLQFKGEFRHTSGLKRAVLFTNEPDPGDVLETDLGFRVTSPLMTLFILARFLSTIDLAMLMYEACGWFSFFEPSESIESLLSELGNPVPGGKSAPSDLEEDETVRDDHWIRIVAKQGENKGKHSKLWRRPPLISVDELRDFARAHRRDRYGLKFYEAASLVFGVTASPLEVQAALLFALPRCQGGYGFEDIFLNDRTPLSAKAKRLTWAKAFYGDVLLVNPKTMRTVIVECQGEMIHGCGAILPSDSNRMLALQTSGYDVLLVEHKIFNDPEQFAVVVKTICEKLGLLFDPKNYDEALAESELRSKIFCDWSRLGFQD